MSKYLCEFGQRMPNDELPEKDHGRIIEASSFYGAARKFINEEFDKRGKPLSWHMDTMVVVTRNADTRVFDFELCNEAKFLGNPSQIVKL